MLEISIKPTAFLSEKACVEERFRWFLKVVQMADRLRRVSHSFLSPETVKCTGVFAIRKVRRNSQALYKLGLLAIVQIVQEEEQLALCSVSKLHTQIPTMPWLGVDFEKLDCDRTTCTPRPEHQCLPVNTDSKDAQGTGKWQEVRKCLLMNTAVVDERTG